MNRVLAGARRIAAHPGWLPEYARISWDRRKPSSAISLTEHPKVHMSERDAVIDVLGLSAPTYDAMRARVWMPPPVAGDHTAWRSREPLLAILGVAVRAMRPDAVVETGVERGFSSAVILSALDENHRGKLDSIDLPPLGVEPTFTGRVVPEQLGHRWDLTIGPSRLMLPTVLRRTGPVDLFLHDADHTYASQLDEFRTLWPFLRPGGLLVCDDVWHSALPDFSRQMGTEATLVRRWDDTDAIGLVCKP